MSLAIFATKAELVFADVVGKHVGDHAGNVVATFGRRDANLLKTRDSQIRGAKKFGCRRRVGAEEQLRRIVPVIVGDRVPKHLVEVVDTDQYLVRCAWCQH